jgi:hypothetical protein
MKQFDYQAEDRQLSSLSVTGDSLEQVVGCVNFELFQPILDAVYQRNEYGGVNRAFIRPPVVCRIRFLG